MAVITLEATTPYTITYKISEMTPQYVHTAQIELYRTGIESPIKTAIYRDIDVARTEILFGYFTGLNPETSYRVHSLIFDENGNTTSDRENTITTKPVFYGTPNSVVHSINIATKTDVWNTFENFGLVPAERPDVIPPEVKTQYVDLPASDGVLDYTELLLGKTPFGRRQGSWRFYTDEFKMRSLNLTWHSLYQFLLDNLNGTECEVSLDDDQDYFYKGRISVNQWRSLASFSEITLDYNFDSYKYSRVTSDEEDWQWDVIFDEPDATIIYGDYSSQEYRVINFLNEGEQPTVPSYISSGNVSVATGFGGLINEIILGQWGYGETRFDNLEAAGYCWQIVQNAVNEALGSSYRYPVPPDGMNEKTRALIESGQLNTGTSYDLKEGSNYNENLALTPGDNVMVVKGTADIHTVYRETEL